MEPVPPSAPWGEWGSERLTQLSRTHPLDASPAHRPRAEGCLLQATHPTGNTGQIQALLAVCSQQRGLGQCVTSSTTNHRPRLRALGGQPCVEISANGNRSPLNKVSAGINPVRDRERWLGMRWDDSPQRGNLHRARRRLPLELRAWLSLGET